MNIEDQIDSINVRNADQVIDFYNENELYFDSYERLSDHDRISKFIDVKLFYCNSLTDKRHIDKVLKTLKHVDALLNKLPTDYPKYNESKRHSDFLKAMALSNQKKYKLSYPLLKNLVNQDPDHHYYRIWYEHAKLGLYSWIFNLFGFIGFSFVILYIALSELEIDIGFDIGNVGIAIMLISFLIHLGLEKYIKRKKNLH